jgi:hypothetical protein
MDGKFVRPDLAIHGQALQSVDDIRYFDIGWAARRALIAGSADPDGLGTQNALNQAGAEKSDQFARLQIHGVGYRAGSRTGAALNAALDLFTVWDFQDFPEKGGVQIALAAAHCTRLVTGVEAGDGVSHMSNPQIISVRCGFSEVKLCEY